MPSYDKFKHETLIECLRKIYDIANNSGIKVWIDSGTLLGIYRKGSLIDRDDDIDLCIDRKDFDKFKHLILNSNELSLQTRIYSKNGTVYLINKIGLYGVIDFCLIDLFVMDGYINIEDYKKRKLGNKSNIGKEINKIIGINCNYHIDLINLDLIKHRKILDCVYRYTNHQNNIEQTDFIGYGITEIYPKRNFIVRREIVYPLMPYAFGDIKLYMPNISSEYLRTMYGDDFMTPKPCGFTHFKSNSYRNSFIR